MSIKVYTKKGDRGTTSLFGGKKLPKHDLRIEAYGTVDELNSYLGLIYAFVGKLDPPQGEVLRFIQDRLFTIGSNLASDPEKEMITPDLLPEDLSRIEEEIDGMEKELKPLKNFVLPGSSKVNAQVHIARTVCRRAERRVTALSEISKVEPTIVQFLNRLSDYLFVLSRFVTLKEGGEEIYWNPRT
jgi:cob(I)alamin adenosyltransferase